MSVRIERLSKHFGDFRALDAIDLEIARGELVALLGPSGSGKTTLLRILAGLEYPDDDGGQVLIDDHDVTRATPAERRIGLVFQHYALFNHLTVHGNVAFGLRMRRGKDRVPAAEIDQRVRRLIALVQLDGLADRYPAQLSGGQRQRVGLARALAIEPRVLLLDEPFGALDAQVRRDLRRWLKELHAELGVTSVFVTHDQEEALEIASRVVVMNAGRVEQVGAPDEVYMRPANAFVYEFLGSSSLLRVRGGEESKDRTYVRPHDLELLLSPNGGSAFAALVEDVQVVGPTVRVVLEREHDGGRIEAHLTRRELAELDLTAGRRVWVRPRNLTTYRAEVPRP